MSAGLEARLVIDRGTASRLGITPQMIDNTLYDAFGQRQVSTMFTQLNQYHAVLEVAPEFQKNPRELDDIYITLHQRRRGAAERVHHYEQDTTPADRQPPGAVSGRDGFVQPRARLLAGRRG